VKNNCIPRYLVLLLFSASTLAISACSGGGGSGDDDPQPSTGGTTEVTEVAAGTDETDGTEVDTELPNPDVIPIEDLSLIPTEEVRPFIADGPYADVLKECALADYEDTCKLSTLPYIGHDTTNPTVDDVLNRTLVTHDWMGVRFGEFLQALPADMLNLFQPVTNVILGSDVRPSSFYSSSGQMKIDPWFLWLTVEEKKNISRDRDYRSNFGAGLQFVFYRRYMKGDEYAIPYSSLEDTNERTLEDALLPAAAVLYHELAHANDGMNPGIIENLSRDLTPGEAAELHFDETISVRLYADESLTKLESELYELARIRWRDATPTNYQKSLQADYVGSVMSGEGKSHFYGYFTVFEDVATLFEQTMIKMHFDAESHVGFMNKPINHPDASCDEYIVDWGSRNRTAAPLVLARAKWVAEQILGPSAELDEYVSSQVGQDTPLRVGDDWCNSRFATPPAIAVRSRTNQSTVSEEAIFAHERRMDRRH